MEVKLTYFKNSGKYYTSGKYNTDIKHFSSGVANMYEIVEEVKFMRIAKRLPGVVHGLDFFIIVDCEDGFPALIHPLETE